MKVKKVIYNWFYTNEVGQEHSEYEVGKDGVDYIDWLDGPREIIVRVGFKDGRHISLFNINEIID